MALDKDTLKSALETLFANPPLTASAAAQGWADAYEAYAATAAGPNSGGAPASLSAAKAALKAAMEAAFAGSSLASTASAFGTAFTAFWLTPPVPFPPGTGGNTTPGAVVTVAGAAALASGIAALGVDSHSAAANSWATLLDAFTKTVVVLYPNTPPAVSPITGPIS